MFTSILAIGLGAAVGALLRWQLSVWLNALFPVIPPGTLAANLIGAYVIGVAIALFARHPAWAPEWRLFIITGMMGGLTTFSTFSAEVSTLLQQGRIGWAGAEIAVHVVGSVTLTLLGMASVAAVQRL